ncbi:MAG: DUF58 domain-containing protein, partial [Demequinaceae bacterium]|nr:DUF58 domain-containing protein [Demequinaceae bacterium]
TIDPSLIELDWAALVRLINSRLSQRALVVLLTTLDASLIDSGGLNAIASLQRQHQVLIASVDDPDVAAMALDHDGVAGVYAAAAAARDGLERDAVAARIRQSGAEIVSALPHLIAPRLADTYLALKASGRL